MAGARRPGNPGDGIDRAAIAFSNNDRPGIMLAGAARTFLHRFGVAAGRMVTVLAAHDSGYRAALDLAAAGAGVTIVDGRPEPPADLLSRARTAGITVMAGHVPVDTRGRLRVSAIAVSAVDGDKRRWIACDLVLMAGGWTPSIHLHSQSGGKPVWDPVLMRSCPVTPVRRRSRWEPAADIMRSRAAWSTAGSLAAARPVRRRLVSIAKM